MKALIIDNYDSFTYNLVHLFASVTGEAPEVVRNDEVSWCDLDLRPFDAIVISPGPGHPERAADFGIAREAILHSSLPLLGVCLGLQGMAALSGGSVVRAPEPVHGRTSLIRHRGTDLFAGLPSPFEAARYHSLHVTRPLPSVLLETAWTADEIIMGLAHRTRPQWAVQFHPESIITEYGSRLVANFCELARHHTGRYKRTSSRSAQPAPKLMPRASSNLRASWRQLDIELDAEAAFCTLFAAAEHAFWLDGGLVEPSRSRWSYLGCLDSQSADVIRYQSHVGCVGSVSVFNYLSRSICNDIENAPPCPFHGGYVGWLGYELRNECGSPITHQSGYPDAVFLRASRFIAIDHLERRCYIVVIDDPRHRPCSEEWLAQMTRSLSNLRSVPNTPPPNIDAHAPLKFVLRRSRAEYLHDIEQCLAWILDGETYQVCLTNEISCEVRIDPLTLYRTMRRINPAPYGAFLRSADIAVLSASPERFLRVNRERQVETKPIKGTIARSSDPQSDQQLAEWLRSSEKNRAENVMIVDLLRNDVSRVCEAGSVNVPLLFDIESYATVHQLVSTVRGTLQSTKTVIDLIRATFPGGSMTGAPKHRTLELIDCLEGRARGIYSGALGWIGFDGCADLSVVIRTIIASNGKLTFGVGGGVVAQSTPEAEFAEMMLKAEASIRAIVRACSGSQDDLKFEIEGA